MFYKKGRGIFSGLKISAKIFYLILNSAVFLVSEIALLFLPLNLIFLILEKFKEWKNFFIALAPFLVFLNFSYFVFFLENFGIFKIVLINLKVFSIVSCFVLFSYSTSLTEVYALTEKIPLPRAFKEIFYFCIRFIPELEREIKETIKIGLSQKKNRLCLLETFFVNIFNRAEDLAAAYYLRKREKEIV